MTLQWLLTGAALLAAVVALQRARRVSRRLERLTESYWELRYEHGQLRARIARLEPPQPAPFTHAAPGSREDLEPAAQALQAGATAFVPLSSLKR